MRKLVEELLLFAYKLPLASSGGDFWQGLIVELMGIFWLGLLRLMRHCLGPQFWAGLFRRAIGQAIRSIK